MSSMKSWLPANLERFTPSGNELIFDARQGRALEERQRVEKKRATLGGQYSPLNSAHLRIRAWVQVRMPSDPSHTVLLAIAIATQLTAEDVLSEQRQRAAQRAPDGV